MKAIVQDTYGEPEAVLGLQEIAKPVVKDDEVLVRVHGASVHVGPHPRRRTRLRLRSRLSTRIRGPLARGRGRDRAPGNFKRRRQGCCVDNELARVLQASGRWTGVDGRDVRELGGGRLATASPGRSRLNQTGSEVAQAGEQSCSAADQPELAAAPDRLEWRHAMIVALLIFPNATGTGIRRRWAIVYGVLVITIIIEGPSIGSLGRIHRHQRAGTSEGRVAAGSER
jgi:hypothetical protein